MKGKKVDIDFLSQYISKCISKNIISSEDIGKTAKNEIDFIDEKIKEVENLKILRSKLLDVVATFNKSIKNSRNEIKLLSFYKISNKKLSTVICNSIKKCTLNINNLSIDDYSEFDIMFCIKQLLEYKIIYRIEDNLLKGDMFDEYCEFSLKGV